MKKITLKLENLSVESFETSEVAQERGTIQGHVATGKLNDCGSYIDACPSGMCATIEPNMCVSFDCPSIDGRCILLPEDDQIG